MERLKNRSKLLSIGDIDEHISSKHHNWLEILPHVLESMFSVSLEIFKLEEKNLVVRYSVEEVVG